MLRPCAVFSCLLFASAPLVAQDTVADVIDGLLIQHERESAARSDVAFAVAHERQQLAADLDQAYLDLGDAYQRLAVMANAQGALKAQLERSTIDANDAQRLRHELLRVRDQVAAIRQRLRVATHAIALPSRTSAPGTAPQASVAVEEGKTESGCVAGQCPIDGSLPAPAATSPALTPAHDVPAAPQDGPPAAP